MENIPASQNDEKTILVVDDDPAVLESISALLTGAKYKVLTANSGADALTQAKQYKPEINLLLADFQMPGMSGVDLATKMTAERPQLKVLLMSGFSGGMLVLNEGWHFLAKPFVPSQLRGLISGLVSPDSKTHFARQ